MEVSKIPARPWEHLEAESLSGYSYYQEKLDIEAFLDQSMREDSEAGLSPNKAHKPVVAVEPHLVSRPPIPKRKFEQTRKTLLLG